MQHKSNLHTIYRLITRISLREVLAYIICVLVALIMWYGHAMSSVRNVEVEVQINYVGIPDNIALSEALPQKLSVEVRDAGQRLQVYLRDPLKLTINLSDQFHGRKGEVNISEEVLRRSISDLLHGTSKLQRITPDHISVAYYTQAERKIPIQFSGSISAAREYMLIGEPTLSTTQVSVFGNAKQLDTLGYIQTEAIQISDARDSVFAWVALQAPEQTRLSKDSVLLTAFADRITEKVMTLPIHARRVPENYTLRLFPREATVTLCVSMAHFAEINEDAIRVEAYFPQGNENNIELRVRYNNPFIYRARVVPSHVEYIIEHEEDTNG